MTALLKEGIRSAMAREQVRDRLVISPVLDPASQLGPGTVDLRLGTEFREAARHQERAIDPVSGAVPHSQASINTYVPLGGEFVLHPGQFVLGHTLEYIGLPPDLIGQVLSRSSWGRLGLLVATAVIVHPGYRGILTLELVNAGTVPILLRPGSRIAQLQLWQSDKATSTPYSAGDKYPGDLGPQSPRLAAESDESVKLMGIGMRFNRQKHDAATK